MGRATPSNLVQRVLSSVVLLPLLLVVVWVGGPWLVAAGVAAVLIGLRELYQLFAHTGYRPRTVGYVCAVLFVLAAALRPHFRFDLFGLVLVFTVLATLISELPRRQVEGAMLAWALTLSGAIYIGWTFAHFILLRQVSQPLGPAPVRSPPLDSGTAWILVALLITFASDTMAYFVGRAMGRHRMAPNISPGKTWEGAIAGLIGAVFVGALMIYLTGLPVGPLVGGIMGGVGSAAGQAGDLSESLLKRQAGVKDSGTLIPGHGGLLDRADSLLFTVPALYYLVHLLTA